MSPSNTNPPILTILTATWNRCDLLPRLYTSLLEQKVPEGSFEWLVVDDGSTDRTSDWLAEIAVTASFPVRVFRQENGGKHRAVNRGARELISDWVMILDSDDWISPHGLFRALTQIRAVDSNQEILAIISPNNLRGRDVKRFDLPGHPVNFATWLHQTQVGDTNVLMRSALMQAFPFPEYEGEPFIAESSAFSTMFRSGGILLSNEIIAEGEYQPDGLSARSLALRVASPLGAMHSYRARLQAGVGLGQHIRCQINYHRFWWHALAAGRKRDREGGRLNPLWLLPGWLMYHRDKRMIRSDQG